MSKVYFTWDDGCVTDLKLFDLHRKYEIPGIFFVPHFNREGRPVLSCEQIKDNHSPLIQFGGHTENHIYLTELNIDDAEIEIIKNKEYLENILASPINHFCFPGGKYNDELMRIVFKHYKTARTTDTVVTKNKGSIIKPTFHIYPRGKKSLILNAFKNMNVDAAIYFIIHFKMNYFELIRRYTERLIKSKKDFSIIFWGHSWEIEELNLWKEIEEIFIMIRNDYPECIADYDDISGVV